MQCFLFAESKVHGVAQVDDDFLKQKDVALESWKVDDVEEATPEQRNVRQRVVNDDMDEGENDGDVDVEEDAYEPNEEDEEEDDVDLEYEDVWVVAMSWFLRV
jgi:hypothetical protein